MASKTSRSAPSGKPPRRLPRQGRAKATVDAILTATAELLGRAGLSRLSTNRIAKRAGVSIGSVYQYFPNKKGLLAALIHRERELVRELTASTLASAETEPLEIVVGRVVAVVLEHQRARATIHDALFHEAARELEDEPHAGHASRRSVEEVVTAFLSARASEIDVGDVRRAGVIIVKIVSALAHDSIVAPRRELDGDALVSEITRMIVGYLRSPRP